MIVATAELNIWARDIKISYQHGEMDNRDSFGVGEAGSRVALHLLDLDLVVRELRFGLLLVRVKVRGEGLDAVFLTRLDFHLENRFAKVGVLHFWEQDDTIRGVLREFGLN
jgi:hypothetical protein